MREDVDMLSRNIGYGVIGYGVLFALAVFLTPTIVAQSLKPGQMAINNIPMKNITVGKESADEIVFAENANERFVFYSMTNEFWIHVLGQPYADSRKKAEANFLKALAISKNEACYLDVSVMVPVLNYRRGGIGLTESDLPPVSPYALPFCQGSTQVNLNDDTVINGADFAQCLADYENKQEDMPCDFNVNRRIDATDLSKMLQYMNAVVPEATEY